MHNTYILLRNNVESTALGLDDLKKTGLLPTDLIWVECQSVNWRHPHEIAELKALLTETVIPKPCISDELLEKYSPKAEQQVPVQSQDINIAPVQSKGNSLKKKEPPVAVATENPPVTINSSYNTPIAYNTVPEMKETPPAGHTPDIFFPTATGHNKPDLLESLLAIPRKKLALYAGLVAAGAIMMLIIMGTGNDTKISKQPVTQLADHPAAEIPAPTPPEEPIIPSEDSTTLPESFNQQSPVPADAMITPTDDKQQALPPKQPVPVKKAEVKKELVKPAAEPVTTKNAVANEPSIEKPATPANINAQLRIQTNEYNVAAFGGIRNLVLTLQNNSSHFLDKVAVQVHYLNPEGAIVKTDIVDFKLVRPGETSTVAVKKSSRGVKVTTSIVAVETKELAAIINMPEGNSN